jgi:hypothetical protein
LLCSNQKKNPEKRFQIEPLRVEGSRSTKPINQYMKVILKPALILLIKILNQNSYLDIMGFLKPADLKLFKKKSVVIKGD